MNRFELHLDDDAARRLEQASHDLGLSTEELLRAAVQEKLHRLEDTFKRASEYVIEKNKQLYHRLA